MSAPDKNEDPCHCTDILPVLPDGIDLFPVNPDDPCCNIEERYRRALLLAYKSKQVRAGTNAAAVRPPINPALAYGNKDLPARAIFGDPLAPGAACCDPRERGRRASAMAFRRKWAR